MSLPLKAIDRLWERLMLTYGSPFLDRYRGMDEMQVRSMWGHELAGYAGKLEPIAWALENLPERPPNVLEFRNICRRAPAPEVPKLPEPKADPERVAAELGKLGEVRAKVLATASTGKEWAQALRRRNLAGDRLTMAQQAMWRAALGEEAQS